MSEEPKIIFTDGKGENVDYAKMVDGMNNCLSWLYANRDQAIEDIKYLLANGLINEKNKNEIGEKIDFITSNIDQIETDKKYFETLVKDGLDKVKK